ncbi:DNA polymerase III subunit delta' [Tepidibacillus fermentans]|uniref:DNA polymerase III subunit delta' n=1 Tax=Tepidibacillus fermentans TaxID=1281767 RepID=A0A4R3K5E3_9BACI|nr:DNA polymerase III subunit delta' [Tepidibacillus fermentans]TCS77955.1 DNA polymerase-3 subunit delta' [Tepidibacillus fermentans]
MSFEQVIGQQRVAEQLKRSIQNNRVGHAYIFVGPTGVGKAKMAIEFAKALNCEDGNGNACDHCLHCRKINHHNHPDVIFVKPEKQSITIDQIRQLQHEFHYKAMDSKRKVYIIEQAEKMTTVAANSLLKFIEEPHPFVTILFLVENLHMVLPTIRSRCQVIYFSLLKPTDILELFQQDGYSEQEILLAAYLTNDRNEVKELAISEWFAQMKSLMIQWVKEILSKSPQALLSIQEKILKDDEVKEQLPRFLDLLLVWYRDILNIRLHRHHAVIFKDYLDLLNQYGLNMSENQLLDKIEQILETKRRIASHVHPQLALEQLVILLQEG